MEDDRGPVEGISAVTLAVRDMARSVGFYRVLGFRVRFGGSEAVFTSLRAGTGYLNLQLTADDIGTSWGRIVIWVDDVDAMYRRARAAGLATATTPADASWGERYFHIHDPDGHELSFARPLPS